MTFVVAGIPFFISATIAAALAALVFYHGPDKVTNRALATLMLATAVGAFGSGMGAVSSTVAGDYRSSWWAIAGTSVTLVAYTAAIPLAFSWPSSRPWAPRVLTRLWPFAGAGLLVAYAFAFLEGVQGAGPASILSLTGAVFVAVRAIVLLSVAAPLLLLVEARREQDPALRHGCILMGLGLGLTVVYAAASSLVFLPETVARVASRGSAGWIAVAYAPLVAILAVTLSWVLWRLPASRTSRMGRFLFVAAAVSGAIESLGFFAKVRWRVPYAPDYELALFLYALWILVPTALLAYVVLRGQIPGLDVKVRWGLSKSTVAAVFIAVFFIVSETTQQFFGETLGSAYVGIAAAGTLVFAIAPLQRAAERLAEKAIPAPIDSPRARAAPDAQEVAYRAAVRLALRGGISRNEELDLARIAEAHALSPLRALQLRHEVEESDDREAAT